MHRFAFRIELLDDVVISRRSATVGGHESLDYLPGQVLLGAAARLLYDGLGSDAYTVFHSGRVRFGQAWPLDPISGVPGWPMPFCWHEKKKDPALVGGRLDAGKVRNFQHVDGFPEGSQPKQLRAKYLHADGSVSEPRRELRMKTAIDRRDGRAAEGQLFGYQSMPRGTRFGGWIEADADIDSGLFDRVTGALAGADMLLLGRSRSAEYGRARLIGADFAPPAQRVAGTGLTLWLLSDLALWDAWGQPTLTPKPEFLGLPAGAIAGEIVWKRTFIRTRSYRPWNGKRGAPDLERPVIEQGSVIRYRLDKAPDPSLLESGLGLYREAGLGRVWANPELLAGKQPSLSDASESRPGSAAAEPLPAAPKRPSATEREDPLIAWLRARTDDSARGERIERDASGLVREYREVLRKAAAERGIEDLADFGPSRAQWGRVLETARTAAPQDLERRLFEDRDRRTGDAVVKPTAEGWQEAYWNGRAQVTLAVWLQERLTRWRSEQERSGVGATRVLNDLPRLVQRLAHLCREETGRR